MNDINDNNENSAASIIATVERLVQPTPIQIEEDEQGRPRVVALPKGLALHSLKPFEDERRTAPERKTGTSKHTTLDSFCAIVDRFADPDSAIFADDSNERAPRILAVFDYHEANTLNDEGEMVDIGEPRFGLHRAVYPLPVSPEWQAWKAIDGVSLSQRDLCGFLEEHIVDVIDPSRLEGMEGTLSLVERLGVTLATPAQVLTTARGLSIKVDTKIVQAVNLSSGESEFTFEESHRDKDGAPIRIHRGFAIQVPVFNDGDTYVVVVRLTYKRANNGLVFELKLQRADRVFRDAFTQAAQAASDRTGVPLFYGTPES